MRKVTGTLVTATITVALALPAVGSTAAASTPGPTPPDTRTASQTQATTAARRCYVTPKARVRAVILHRTKSVRSVALRQINKGQRASAVCTASKGNTYSSKGSNRGCTPGRWWVKTTWRERTGWVALGCVRWYVRATTATASKVTLSAVVESPTDETSAVAMASAVASAQATSAVARCRGASCSGKNPQVQGCGKDARTIDRVRPGGGGPVVELRRSRRCRAAWARIQKANPSWRFLLQVRNGPIYTGHASLLYRAYTKMTGSTKPYRACVKAFFGGWSCTRWH